VIRVVREEKGIVFTSQIVEMQCADCLTGGIPTTFKKEVTTGNLTQMVYSEKVVNTTDCEHRDFEVDETTVKKQSDTTLGGTIAGMLTAGWFQTRYYYLTAQAKCIRCDRKFRVRCDYSREVRWENYKEVESERREAWEIVMIRVDNPQQEKISQIAYV
jgi:hypothetical protein